MGKSPEYLKRLEALNGGPLRERPAETVDVEAIRRTLRRPAAVPPPPAEPIRSLRDLPRPIVVSPAAIPLDPHVPLEEVVAGVEVQALPGQAYLITTPLAELGEAWSLVREEFRRAITGPGSGLCRRLAHRCDCAEWAPEDVLFVDLETTGLGHSPLFLIGTLVWEDGELVAQQYLARHYGEEPAVTHLFVESARAKRLLVTFNGKSFDYPYIRARAAANGIPCRLRLAHFDLLHECRRVWRGVLPNCRLQTLEQHVCGRPPRHDDIPGAQIPEAYHAFVRTANAAQIARIIRHNLLDLVTLAELMGRLPAEG